MRGLRCAPREHHRPDWRSLVATTFRDESGVNFYTDRFARLTPVAAACPADRACGERDWFVKRAWAFVEKQGWQEIDMSSNHVVRLLIDGYSKAWSGKTRFQKGVVVLFPRCFKVSLLPWSSSFITEDPDSGTIAVALNNDGVVVAAWKRWTHSGSKRPIEIISFDTARECARRELGTDAPLYQVWRFQITDHPAGAALTPFYEFYLVPLPGVDALKHPLRRIEIDASANCRSGG